MLGYANEFRRFSTNLVKAHTHSKTSCIEYTDFWIFSTPNNVIILWSFYNISDYFNNYEKIRIEFECVTYQKN